MLKKIIEEFLEECDMHLISKEELIGQRKRDMTENRISHEDLVKELGEGVLKTMKSLLGTSHNGEAFAVWFQGEKFSIAIVKGTDIILERAEDKGH